MTNFKCKYTYFLHIYKFYSNFFQTLFMDTSEKLNTLIRIFDTLMGKGTIQNKKGFAVLLGVNYAGLVAAMNGNEKYLTDSLVAKAVSLLNEPIPKKEKTDMEKAIEAIQSSNQITLKAQEHTDRLLALLEQHFNRLERDNT